MLAAARRVGHYGEDERPKDARELASRIFYTVYMGTENRCAHLALRLFFPFPDDEIVSSETFLACLAQ